MTEKDINIGVYVCDCGLNIAGVVDVPSVVEYAKELPQVSVAREYRYMCSSPGQELIGEDIRELGLDRVVIASCSPHLHERTFRQAVERAGGNAFLMHMVNIREHVSWVTHDAEKATQKAKRLVAAGVARVARHAPLERVEVPVREEVLVIGAGIAGIQAALTAAEAGRQVYLVERDPSIGGNMARFDKTFPTLDCSACILTPKMNSVGNHPNIELLTLAEVREVSGSPGDFAVTVSQRPRYIDHIVCTSCGECVIACPVDNIPNEYDMGLSHRTAIYRPFEQAVPSTFLIDGEHCVRVTNEWVVGPEQEIDGVCRVCEDHCSAEGGIDFGAQPQEIHMKVGTIIVATGYKTFDARAHSNYGYGRYPEVYTGLEMERLAASNGPTAGQIRLKDGREPKAVAIVHCVGSRDENHNRYCSKVCCMYSLKFAHLIKERTGAEVYNFYIDIRAGGKNYEEFYQRLLSEDVNFIRGKVASITDLAEKEQEQGKLIVVAEDTLLDRIRRVPVDMVILSTAMEPQDDKEEVRRMLNMSCSSEGFFMEKHPKLGPVGTINDGIFIAGACQGPKDIPETVAQAEATVAETLALTAKGFITLEPDLAYVEEELCAGCQVCLALCPYNAITRDDEKKVAVIDQLLCKGCGTCVAACPSGAARQRMFEDEQLLDELVGVLT